MKRLLQVIGIITLVLIVAGIGAVVVLARAGSQLDAESAAYIDATVPALLSNRSADFLLGKMTPESRQVVTPDALRTVYGILAQLGRVTEYAGATGEAHVSYFIGTGRTISANYVAKAYFENGDATILVTLKKTDDNWNVQFFHVNVDSLRPGASQL